jgi:WD40 repeat protein
MVPAPPQTTALPVSCRAMPPAFFFPPPAADAPGLFTRCASFEVGAATALAVSPDGRLVALVTADGLARIIAVESQQVIAVLASPRGMTDAVAYEPHGLGVLTMARAQREVTFWRASDWTPIWRVTLPGTPYYHTYNGGLAFAPDGRSAVVSPGSDTFLLDVETGALRARRTNTWDAVLDVAYGWGGRRIVVAEPSLAAHCQHNPNGGVVTILDPETLATIATAVDLGDYNSPGGYRGGGPVFRASPVDDLVLALPRIEDGPDVRAFRLSDGGALPAPAITAMPVAFSPDGGSVLMTDGAALERVRVSDGSIVWTTMLGQLGSFGMSADGGVLAFGGAGAQLLRVVRAGDSVPAAVCAADEPSTPVGTPVASSLSSDGQLVALAAPNEIRVVRRGDGTVVTRIRDGLSTPPAKVTLSPFARYVVTNAGTASVSSVFRVADGTRAGAFPIDTWNWASFVFSSREDRVYSNGFRNAVYQLNVIDLGSGTSSDVDVPERSVVLGTSNGCPVLYQRETGTWRACGACDDPPVGGTVGGYDLAGPLAAALSSDGAHVAIWPSNVGAGVELWKLPPGAGKVATLAPRAPWPGWSLLEFPVAVTPGGGRVLTGAVPAGSCYFGPAFPTELHDVGTNTVVDTLPPGPSAVDGAVRTIAYGAQLWCAR